MKRDEKRWKDMKRYENRYGKIWKDMKRYEKRLKKYEKIW